MKDPTDDILRYDIVHCTSEDPENPIQALYANKDGGHHGWQSARYCLFPQNVIVRFEGEVRIRQIKILSHECKIAKKIEIYISQVNPGSVTEGREGELANITYKDSRFKRIGYLSLDANEEKNFRARELKTVQLDLRSCFIKLALQECHVNDLNLYNQVGLVAIQFIGEVITRFPVKILAPLVDREILQVQLEDLKPDKKSLLKQQDIDQPMDQVTATRIEELRELKEKAIFDERYIDAQRYKDMMDNLKRIGAKLFELEKQKENAKEAEDFERAQYFKLKIDQLRKEAEVSDAERIYQEIISRATSPMDHAYQPKTPPQVKPQADVHSSPQPGKGDRNVQSPMDENSSQVAVSQDPSSPPTVHIQNEASPRHKSGGHDRRLQERSSVEYDERPIRPADNPNMFEMAVEADYQDSSPLPARHDRNRGISTVSASDDIHDNNAKQQGVIEMEGISEWEQQLVRAILNEDDISVGMDPGKMPVTENVTTQAAVFGQYATRALYSKNRAFREGAVKAITSNIKNLPAEKSAIYIATLQYLRSGLEDKIPQVFQRSLTLMKKAVQSCSKSVKRSSGHSLIYPLIETLVNKMGDPRSRTRTSCSDMLLFLAGRKAIGPEMVFQHCLRVPKNVSAWRLVASRLQMLSMLIENYSMTGEIASVGAIARFVKKFLEHPNGEVRASAVRLVTDIVKVDPSFRLDRFLGGMKEVLVADITKACAPFLERNEVPIEQDPGRQLENGQRSRQKKKKRKKRSEHEKEERRGDMEEAQLQEQGEQGEKAQLTEYGMCIFCGMGPFESTEEHDYHLVLECKMLTTCPLCNMVTDIKGLVNHMAKECSASRKGRQCPRCKLIFHKDDIAAHKKSKRCKNISAETDPANRCYLCLAEIPQDGWVRHLLHDGCPANPK